MKLVSSVFLVLSIAIAPLLSNAEPVLAAACPTAIIHRGNTQLGAAENTYKSFVDTFNLGLTWVESDTYFTSDNHPVLFHNPTVDSVTNGSGSIATMTLEQFKTLRYKNGQPTSSLYDVLPLFTNANSRHLLLEIKHTLTSVQQQKLISVLNGYEPAIHLNGFAPTLSSLVAIKQTNDDIDISYLAYDGKNNLVKGMSGKNIQYSKVNYIEVSTLKRSGYIVRAWTPNTVSDWRLMKLAGVDAIITDKAAEYKNWVTEGCI